MSAATVPRMGRKKNTPGPEAQPARQSTAVVRVEGDLAQMLSIIATATGREISEIVSPMIRKQVEAEYAEVVRTLNKKLTDKKEGQG